MLVCPFCEQAAIDDSCLCGSDARVRLNDKGIVLTMHGTHGFACQRCGATDEDLALRLYKRVVGMFVFDQMYSTGGYFCASCRRKQFGKHMGLTLVLGWWGVFALLFRNPWAIMTNVRALFGPPVAPQEYGGLAIRALYPTGDEIQYERDVLAGLVEDTWHCTTCDRFIVGHDDALKHADMDHQDISLKAAQAALRPVTKVERLAD